METGSGPPARNDKLARDLADGLSEDDAPDDVPFVRRRHDPHVVDLPPPLLLLTGTRGQIPSGNFPHRPELLSGRQLDCRLVFTEVSRRVGGGWKTSEKAETESSCRHHPKARETSATILARPRTRLARGLRDAESGVSRRYKRSTADDDELMGCRIDSNMVCGSVSGVVEPILHDRERDSLTRYVQHNLKQANQISAPLTRDVRCQRYGRLISRSATSILASTTIPAPDAPQRQVS
jgi:hypothetical protein